MVTELSIKSKLDEFRLFFDLKQGPWDRLRGQLNTHVQSNYSWTSLRDSKTLRLLCAEEFLEEYATKYWGDENRENNLIEDRLDGKDSGCKYPDDETPKKAIKQMLDVNQLDSTISTPLPSVEITQRFPSRQKETAGGLFGPGRLITGGYLASPRAATEGLISRYDLMSMSLLRPSVIPGQFNASAGLLRKDDPPTTEVVQRPKTHPGSNMLATYFLVTSSEFDNPQEPVCVPFEFYHDADDFLNKMENKAGDAVSQQLLSEMVCLNRCYAVVHLNWSGVSFVIRRGGQDLQALENRVICAWNAKDEGALNMIEFEIGVTLKPDI
ncbi:uncharacterized protein N7477_004087 [Penicillium maclennaniae]|uniref:uncharacterized protein n=1 Tax=Penicillium maclennaniae TaxID=1343394 RepID=UPI0025418D05|nr:uncharacterized protein N7477_004087 [Penicillium maclennaniae]KAJ5678454.1 hypothetical protein N7477_004087 [Penicillium maclennaniae]